MKCTNCGSERFHRRTKEPLAKALEILWPFDPFSCYQCGFHVMVFRRTWDSAVSVVAGLTISAFLIHAVTCLILHVVGFRITAFDQNDIFQGVPSAFVCAECGSTRISRSVQQPLERAIYVINFAVPYRCWDCWDRTWEWKTMPGLALPVGSWLALVTLIGLCTTRFRERRAHIQAFIGDPAEVAMLGLVGFETTTAVDSGSSESDVVSTLEGTASDRAGGDQQELDHRESAEPNSPQHCMEARTTRDFVVSEGREAQLRGSGVNRCLTPRGSSPLVQA